MKTFTARERVFATVAAATTVAMLFAGSAAYAAVTAGSVSCEQAAVAADGSFTMKCKVAPPATTPPSPTHSASPSPSPTATPTPTPTVGTGGYRVVGRDILDGAGVKFRPVGAELPFWGTGKQGNWYSTANVTEIAATGANFVRILPFYSTGNPYDAQSSPATLAQIEDMIKRAINGKMMVDVAIDGGSNLGAYERPEVKALLQRYAKYIAIHVGESQAGSEAAWRDSSINSIRTLRTAGYTSPIYVISNGYGRKLTTILNQCQAVRSATDQNVIFGWQAYWGSSGYWQGQNGMTLAQGFERAAASPCAIQAGLIHRTDWCSEEMDYRAAMDQAKARGIGWAWWDWRIDCDALVNGGDRSTYVKGRIAAEAVRTPWMLAQSI